MRRRWIRVPPEASQSVTAGLVAGALAAGVGVVSFWLVRTLLAREPLPEAPSEGEPERREGQ